MYVDDQNHICYDETSIKDLLTQYPRGVYTCIRCFLSESPESIEFVKLSLHLDRLQYGYAKLFQSCINRKQIELFIIQSVKLYKEKFSNQQKLITSVLLYRDSDSGKLATICHIAKMPTPALSVKSVLISNTKTQYHNRESYPLTKDSKWVLDRKIFDQELASFNVSEVIITDKSSTLVLEGLVTNVFVLYNDNMIWTCLEGVLSGVSRAIVIEACVALGIKIKFDAPRVQDALDGKWIGMALSNATKPLTIVESCIFSNTNTEVQFDPTQSILKQLQEYIQRNDP